MYTKKCSHSKDKKRFIVNNTMMCEALSNQADLWLSMQQICIKNPVQNLGEMFHHLCRLQM